MKTQCGIQGVVMQKVEVTKEQAKAIEYITRYFYKEDIVRAHVKGMKRGGFEEINRMNINELIGALYIGYKVKGE